MVPSVWGSLGAGMRLATLGSVAIALACQESSGPTPDPGIRFVAGAGQTDTANARLTQPIRNQKSGRAS